MTALAWIPIADALALLDVKPQTLYANVSRGRVRAKPDPANSQRSLYLRSDLERLAAKRAGKRRSDAIASGTIQWGDPVMPSGISTIAEGRLWYRGVDAIVLSQSASLEEVAGLLWEGPSLPATKSVPRVAAASSPLTAALLAIAGRAGTDLPTLGRSASVLREDAASVFFTLLDALVPITPTRPSGSAANRNTASKERFTNAHSISERIALAWGCPRAEDTIRRTLVLLADHELNASTFAARVAASTGASLSASVLAGLCALSGPLHGRASAFMQALTEAAQRRGAAEAVREHATQGHGFAAFGHPLYPDGDPRSSELLQHIRVPSVHADIAQAVERLVGERPNIDFALSALTRAHRLPPDAPLTLFAIARCVGWLAHALEQSAQRRLIRPRARYTGPAVPALKGTTGTPGLLAPLRTQSAESKLSR